MRQTDHRPLFSLKIWSEMGQFTMPGTRVDPTSSPGPTPSASRGILRSIYWHPNIRWVIRRIEYLSEIRYLELCRNEIKQKEPIQGDPCIFPLRCRTQRRYQVLYEPCFVIKAELECQDGESPHKHWNIAKRRAQKGQRFTAPYMGKRCFPCFFEIPSAQDQPLDITMDMGTMFYDFDFEDGEKPYWFHAQLENGVMHIPHPSEVMGRS
jgi:CRISPR-associated protein Cas5d